MRRAVWVAGLILAFSLGGSAAAGPEDRPRDTLQAQTADGPTIDPALGRGGPRLRRAADGTPRTAAAVRVGDAPLGRFVEDELILTTASPAEAQGLAQRYGGKVLRKIARPAATGRGATYIIRVDSTRAPEHSFGPSGRRMTVSSPAARGLLAIAAEERAHGLKPGLNVLFEGANLNTGVTREAGNVDAGSWDYMAPGGLLDVDVIDAWRALSISGKLGNKVRIAVIDEGFGLTQPGFKETDWPKGAVVLDGGGPSSQGNPWHGADVVDALAAVPDDQTGAAGPAGPVAQIVAVDSGEGVGDMIDALWKAREWDPRIINISRVASVGDGIIDAVVGWFEGLDTLEDDTEWISVHSNTLIFAAAGNSGKNVDDTDDGDETVWWVPCENHGVICVGGWSDPGTGGLYGIAPANLSNYGSGKGDTVDIWGPFSVKLGNSPSFPKLTAPRVNSGTSLSSPFVAGVAALIWAADPKLTSAEVWSLMNQTAVQAGPKVRRVRAYAAVRQALTGAGGNAKPWVQITAPKTGVKAGQNSQTVFTVKSFDPEDGPNCCTVIWTSTVDGVLGKGFALPVSFAGKPLGWRVIKAEVADGHGQIGSAVIAVELTNAAPTVKIIKQPSTPVPAGTLQVFAAQVFDDTGLANVPDAKACETVAWGKGSSLAGQGCEILLSFPQPGQVVVTAAYADAYGAKGSAKTVVTVVAAAPDSPSVSLLKPTAGDAFDAEEFVPVAYKIVDPTAGAGQPPPYDLKWELTWLEGGETRTPPTGKGLGFRFVDVFPELATQTGFSHFRLALTVTNAKTGKSSNTAGVDLTLRPEIH